MMSDPKDTISVESVVDNETDEWRYSKMFGEFDPRQALRILSLQNEEFFGQRVNSFAGFCAWVISPTDQFLIRDAMLLKADEEYERLLYKRSSSNRFGKLPSRTLREIAVRKKESYRGFFENIYAPSRIPRWQLSKSSHGRFIEDYYDREVSIPYVLKLMAILHYVAVALPSTDFLRPSITRGAQVFSKLSSMGFDIAQRLKAHAIALHWNESRASAAFLYAAHLVKVTPDETLLDLILARKLTYRQAKPHLQKWFECANGLIEKVLVHVKDTRGILPEFLTVPQVAPVDVPAPDVSPPNVKKIQDAFRKKAQRNRVTHQGKQS